MINIRSSIESTKVVNIEKVWIEFEQDGEKSVYEKIKKLMEIAERQNPTTTRQEDI